MLQLGSLKSFYGKTQTKAFSPHIKHTHLYIIDRLIAFLYGGLEFGCMTWNHHHTYQTINITDTEGTQIIDT